MSPRIIMNQAPASSCGTLYSKIVNRRPSVQVSEGGELEKGARKLPRSRSSESLLPTKEGLALLKRRRTQEMASEVICRGVGLPASRSQLTQLLTTQGVVLFLAFAWMFIVEAVGRRLCAKILVVHIVLQTVPMIMALKASRSKGASLMPMHLYSSVTMFTAMLMVTPFALHVALGGWAASAYLLNWAVLAVMLMPAYNVPFQQSLSVTVIAALVFLADMMVEFQTVELLPGILAWPILLVHGSMRTIIGVEPIPSLPPLVYSMLVINNFFMPMGLCFWMLHRTTTQRQQWQDSSDAVLYNLVPFDIADRLRAGASRKELTQRHCSKTCFFSDLVGFTSWSSSMKDPAAVTAVLDDMYTVFDRIADLTGVYKVETIGDSYFAVATLDVVTTPQESAYRATVFAMAICEFLGGPFGQSRGLQVRCGLNTGNCVTGVLGRSRPRFVVVGDTVNVASRMETTARPGTVHVSQTTALLIQDYFELTRLPPIDIKGKGMMDTFEVGPLKPLWRRGAFGLRPFSARRIEALVSELHDDFEQDLKGFQ